MQAPILLAILEYGLLMAMKRLWSKKTTVDVMKETPNRQGVYQKVAEKNIYHRKSHNEEKLTVLPIKAPMNMEILFKNIDMITFVASVIYFAVFNTCFWLL